jgi:hypothetical protein
MKSWAPHGTVRRYRQGGCNDLKGGVQGEGPHCVKCTTAQREFDAGRKAGMLVPPNSNRTPRTPSGRTQLKSTVTQLDKRRKSLKSVPAQPDKDETSKPSKKPTKISGAVERSITDLQKQHEDGAYPVEFQMALCAARILDDPERVALHPTTLRQLQAILVTLGGPKKKTKGRLATVQAMTARK